MLYDRRKILTERTVLSCRVQPTFWRWLHTEQRQNVDYERVSESMLLLSAIFSRAEKDADWSANEGVVFPNSVLHIAFVREVN